MNWKTLLKTISTGMVLGAAAGSADAITQQVSSGRVDPTSLKGAAMGGAIAGAIGYWLRSPRDRRPIANDFPSGLHGPQSTMTEPRE